MRILISRRFLAYLGTINVIFILLFGPITQETIALPVKQRPLGASTGFVATSMVYTVANPPHQNTGKYFEPRIIQKSSHINVRPFYLRTS